MTEQDLLDNLIIKEDYNLHKGVLSSKYGYDVDVSWNVTNVTLKDTYIEFKARIDYKYNEIDIYDNTGDSYGVYNVKFYNELIFSIKTQDIKNAMSGLETNTKLYNPKLISHKLTDVEYLSGTKLNNRYIDTYFIDAEIDYEDSYIFVSYYK